MRSSRRVGANIIGSFIDAVSWSEAVSTIKMAAQRRDGSYVCICNTHSLVEARANPAFREAVKSALMCTPDGAPVAWMLRRLGFSFQERINGPDLMWRYFSSLNEVGGEESVYFYGGSQDTLDKLIAEVSSLFPRLRIAGHYSPPYRTLSCEEKAEVVAKINSSGASSIWVSLGCPKQEIWMHEHSGKLSAVMVGVGAAFDYHAGVIKRAPLWMQQAGLEWLHRLASEPRRLWRRYFYSNCIFLVLAGGQLISFFSSRNKS